MSPAQLFFSHPGPAVLAPCCYSLPTLGREAVCFATKDAALGPLSNFLHDTVPLDFISFAYLQVLQYILATLLDSKIKDP